MVSLLCGASGRTQVGCLKCEVKIPEPASPFLKPPFPLRKWQNALSGRQKSKCRERGPRTWHTGETTQYFPEGPPEGSLDPGGVRGSVCLWHPAVYGAEAYAGSVKGGSGDLIRKKIWKRLRESSSHTPQGQAEGSSLSGRNDTCLPVLDPNFPTMLQPAPAFLISPRLCNSPS